MIVSLKDKSGKVEYVQRTETLENSVAPNWQSTFQHWRLAPGKDIDGYTLLFEVFDWDRMSQGRMQKDPFLTPFYLFSLSHLFSSLIIRGLFISFESEFLYTYCFLVCKDDPLGRCALKLGSQIPNHTNKSMTIKLSAATKEGED